MPPKVTVVILNYKRAEDTIACVRSVLASGYPDFGILLVDNASGDGSAERLAEAFPELPLVRHAENLGYAGGNNAGIRRAFQEGAVYVLVLNNDTIVKPDALRILVETAER